MPVSDPALAESGYPAERSRSPLEQPARRGERRIADPLSPPTETKNHPRASANSSTWRLKGVRYLFMMPRLAPDVGRHQATTRVVCRLVAECGLSLAETARHLGVSAPAIAKILRKTEAVVS